MPDSENKRPSRGRLFALYASTLLLFLLLLAAPYLLSPFNDQALSRFYASFPNRDAITGFAGELLLNKVKSPYDIVFTSGKNSYSSYEPISFRLALADKQNAKALKNFRPVLRIKDSGGNPLADIFGRTEAVMPYDAQENTYTLTWIPDNTAYRGDITAELEVSYAAFSRPIEEKLSLRIVRYPPAMPVQPSAVFLGLDSKELLSQRRILSVSNKESPIASLSEWLPLLNVDGVLMQAAVSKTYGIQNNEVWDTAKLNESESMAKTFAQKGVKSSLMVQMMELEGIEISRLGYKETKYEGTNKNIYSERSVVSLSDTKRGEDLAAVLARMQKNEDVAYIGLSQVFYGAGYHNELRPLFERLYPEIHFGAAPAFEKWKRFYATGAVRRILKQAGESKPYFIYLSVGELLEMPEMLEMAFSAGISFAVLDLKIEADKADELLAQIAPLLDPFRNRIIFSRQIDYNDFVGAANSAVEAWKDRSLMLLESQNFQGFYMNDLYKAMFGKRGPYPAYEWMISAAALASDWKERGGLLPLRQKMIPATNAVASEISLFIELKNEGAAPLSNLAVSLLPTVELDQLNPKVLTVPSLQRGEMLRTNLVLSNIRFKATVLQKRARFIGLHTSYSEKAALRNHAALLSFIDFSTEPDRIYENMVITNRTVIRETPAPAPVPAPEAPAPPAAPVPAPKPKEEAGTLKQTNKNTGAPSLEDIKMTLETQKLSYAERQRLRRLQKQLQKEAEDAEKK